MSSLIKLAIRANIICIFGMIASAIAVYVLNLGGWKIAGISVFTLLVFFTFAALAISLLQKLVFKPVFSGQSAKLARQALMLSSEDGLSSGQTSFVIEAINAIDKREKTRYIASAIIGVVAYFILGPMVGSPISEFITLGIFLIGPTFFGVMLQGSLNKMRALEPDLFEAARQMYYTAHGVNFDSSFVS